jgi:hypothetical protein
VVAPPEPLVATAVSLGRRIGDALRRHRVDETVRRSEARLQAVLDSALDCVVIADSDGVVIEFNPAACRTFGYTRETAVGSGLAEVRAEIVPGTIVTQVKADMRCAAVAAASVLAKVERDAIMVELAKQHPGYGWELNKGYSAPEHISALRRLGPTHLHRTSWNLPGVGGEPDPAQFPGAIALDLTEDVESLGIEMLDADELDTVELDADELDTDELAAGDLDSGQLDLTYGHLPVR